MAKPAPVNKTASVALAAGMLGDFVHGLEPELGNRLARKADRCLYGRILPAQTADGFWDYSLSGKDPGDKDVLGYAMLTTEILMELRRFVPRYREARLDAALAKAEAFAARRIAPMTDPNLGQGGDGHATPATPRHYALADGTKRSFQLGLILVGGGRPDVGVRIVDAALARFPYGDRGQDGARAAESCALMASWPR